MKKFTILVLFAVTALGFSAKAQIQQGNVLVGADFADISLGLNSPHVFNFNVSPKAAWFVQDNIALGGYVNLGIQTATGSQSVFTYGVGGLGRYYTGKDVEVLRHGRFFAEVEAGLGGINIGSYTSNGITYSSTNTNGFQFSAGPGFAYFVTPSVGLETLVKFNGETGFGNQSFQSKLTLNFGLQVYLPGKGTVNKVKRDVR